MKIKKVIILRIRVFNYIIHFKLSNNILNNVIELTLNSQIIKF